MIWFFIAGFVSGVVGVLMLGAYIDRKVNGKDGIHRQE